MVTSIMLAACAPHLGTTVRLSAACQIGEDREDMEVILTRIHVIRVIHIELRHFNVILKLLNADSRRFTPF